MKRILLAVLCLAAVPQLASALPVQNTRPQHQNGVPKTGFRADFVAGLAEVEEKTIDLAVSVPVDKWSWRPAKGVRSVSEVYAHVAGSNYFLATFVGKQPPADIPKDMEKITDKQRILAELRRSFEFLGTAIASESEADLDKPVKMLGTNTTRRGVYMTILNHLHEHLGQSIAYARMNGVVPPWSR